jgi:hypothetical protein
MTLEQLAGLALVVTAVVLMFIFVLLGRKRGGATFRRIVSILNLQRAVGLALEDGRRLHVSLGSANLLTPANPSALAGLSALQRLSQLGMASDRPPVATSGDPLLAILSQDILNNTAASTSGHGAFQGRLTGLTPLSYATGSISVIRDEQVYTNIFLGNFGPEAAFLVDAADQNGAFSLGASDSLTGQAVLFAMAQEPLIGEELFALPAYLKAGSFHTASLRVQDILRWLVILALTGGIILKLIEVFLGIKIL